MKFLRQKFDDLKAKTKSSTRPKLYHLVNSFDTIHFVPKEVAHKKGGTHIKDGVDLKRTMFTVIIALLPALLFGMYNVGYQHMEQMVALGKMSAYTGGEAFLYGLFKVLPLIIVSYLVGLAIEFAFAIYRGHDVYEGYLVSGLLIPMIVPVDTPLWMLAISVAFAVIIGKEVFGGTGMNIFNPALLSRAFLFFAYPTYMSGNKVWVSDAYKVDALSGETILGQLAQGAEVARPVVDKAYSMYDMFMGLVPGSIGETSVLMILIGAIFLIATGVGSWKIMLSSVIGASFIGMIFNLFGEVNDLMAFDWWKHLMVGGFAFGTVFMATDPVSAAQTERGKWIYGFLVGFFSIVIRVFNPAYPEGVMLAILLMNTFAPTIDYVVVQNNIKKRKKRFQKFANA